MEPINKLAKMSGKSDVIVMSIILMFFLSITASAQSDYNRQSHRYYRTQYKRNEGRLVHACHILNKKRNTIPHKPLLAFHHKPKSSGMAERSGSVLSIDKQSVAADNSKTKPQVKPTPVVTPEMKLTIKPKVEDVSEKKLEQLHKQEDEVLSTNHLPVPTSQKHEEVRKKVASKLASKENVYPLQLEPLYFQFNQDEFSVVDMEPFLMAAEYALQGRTVLIEGHTDTRGMDDFNVKLSIKRVQKIRQLMIDMGVPDDRISVIGYGEEHGKSKDAKSENDHQNNRRVDFTIF
jgi:outer membrane protein OmpA-like peptidoglycan-associated protein